MGRRTVAKVAKDRAVERATSRGSVVAGPVAGFAGELVLASCVHYMVEPSALPWITAGLALSTTGVTAVVYQVGRDRSVVGRALALGTSVLTGAHLVVSSVVGPFADNMLGVWAWGAGSLSAAWAVRLWVSIGGKSDPVSGGGDWWREATGKVGGSLEGSRFRARSATESQVKGKLVLEAGETVADAQDARARLASVLGLPPNGVRVTPDRDNAREGELTLVRKDMLREPHEYVEPSLLGGSSAAPLVVGVYEHGGVAVLPMHIPGWGEAHLLIMGMTGAGKTAGAYVLFGEEFTRTDVFTIYVDTVKGAQSLGPLARGLKWVMRTEAEAHALMAAIKDKVIPARANYLGRRRLKSWSPGCGIPRLRIHVEEGAGLFLGNKDFTRVMERARSVGIQVVLSGQRFSYTAIDVSARAQFSTVWCFGVAESDDARFAMPDTVLDAGADPSVWKNEQPGCAYLVGPGVEKEDHTTPMRTPLISDEQVELLAEYARLHGADLDETTATAFGELWTSRTPMEQILAELDAGVMPVESGEEGAVVDGVVVDRADEEEDVEDDVPQEDRPEPWRPTEQDPAPEVQPDIDDEFVSAPPMRFGQPVGPKPSAEAAAELFERRLVSLQAEGREEVRAVDMAPVAQEAQRSPAWVYKLLNRRVESGHLERTDKGFRFVRALTPT